MGVLRTNEDPTFEDQANVNNHVSDQHYGFSIPSRGSNSYFPVLPKNYGASQIFESDEIFSLSHDSVEDGIVQVFKASGLDNVNGFKTLVKGSHPDTEQEEIIDACEYATDAAVTDVWKIKLADDGDERIELWSNDWESNSGDYCIQVRAHSRAEGNSTYKEFATPQDWDNLTSINFDWESSKNGSSYRWRLNVYDNIGQTAYIDFNAIDKWEWESKEFGKNLFYNTDVIDWSQVVKIEFYCLNVSCTYDSFLNNLQIVRNVEYAKIVLAVQLVHFGTTPDFATLGDIKTLDDNFDSEDLIVEVDNNKISECNIQYGAARNDWKLVDNDYYGIYIKKPTVGTIKFYGSATKTFADGDVYSVGATQDLTALDKSLAFMICTFSESMLRKLTIKQDEHSDKSNINLLLVDPSTKKVKRFLGVYTFTDNDIIEIDYDYSVPETIKVDFESHLYIYYQDAFDSDATVLHVRPRFHYTKTEE